jgi:hypothetical protein
MCAQLRLSIHGPFSEYHSRCRQDVNHMETRSRPTIRKYLKGGYIVVLVLREKSFTLPQVYVYWRRCVRRVLLEWMWRDTLSNSTIHSCPWNISFDMTMALCLKSVLYKSLQYRAEKSYLQIVVIIVMKCTSYLFLNTSSRGMKLHWARQQGQ